MEPFVTAAVAVGSVIATKALEKTGEKIAETTYDSTLNFLRSLKQAAPETATAIEQAPQQPLDCEVVVNVEKVARQNSQVLQAMQKLVAAAEADNSPSFATSLKEELDEIQRLLKIRQSENETYGKLAEEIKAEKGAIVAQKVEIDQQNNTYY